MAGKKSKKPEKKEIPQTARETGRSQKNDGGKTGKGKELKKRAVVEESEESLEQQMPDDEFDDSYGEEGEGEFDPMDLIDDEDGEFEMEENGEDELEQHAMRMAAGGMADADDYDDSNDDQDYDEQLVEDISDDESEDMPKKSKKADAKVKGKDAKKQKAVATSDDDYGDEEEGEMIDDFLDEEADEGEVQSGEGDEEEEGEEDMVS